MNRPIRNPRPRAAAPRRRGSAMILAVAILILVFVVGMALVSASQSSRLSGRATAASTHADLAVDTTVKYIGQQIAKSWTDYLNNVAGSTYEDYPGDKRKWLANIEPWDSSGAGGTWSAWQQVSMTESAFINASTPTTTGSDTDQTLPFAAAAAAGYDATQADADGDGFYDSKWVKLPLASTDGTTWIAAIRIIDNSGLINVNTATQSASDIKGTTPADIDLNGFLATADGSSATWGGAGFNPTTVLTAHWTTASTDFLGKIGLTAVPDNQGDRKAAWDNIGSLLAYRLGLTSDHSGSPTTTHSAYAMSDEMELRLKAAKTLSSRSVLEMALEGSPGAMTAQGALRSFYPNVSSLTADQFKADRRHLLTAYNGLRMHDTSGSGTGPWRSPMPKWITTLTALDDRLNPNTATGAQLGDLFDKLLGDTTNHYEGDANRHTLAGYSLAANLLSYRDNGSVYEPQQITNAGVTYSGLKRQPFITEVMTAIVYTDDWDDTAGAAGADSVITPGKDSETRLVVVELRNPWPANIDLSHFQIVIDGTPVALSGTLAPADYVIVCTNDADLQASLTAAAPGPAIPVGKILPVLAPGAGAFSAGVIELLTTGNIRVDRFRATGDAATWPAQPPVGTPGLTNAGGRYVTSADAARYWDNSSPVEATAGSFGPMPSYVYERFDKTAVLGNPFESVTPGAYQEVAPGANTLPLSHLGSPTPPDIKGVALAPLPPVTQLASKNDLLDTLGELANLFTVCNMDDGGGANTRTFSELMYDRLTEAAGGTIIDLAKLRLTNYVRTAAPIIPVAMTVFDALDILGATTNQPRLCGLININTAPAAVLENLPYLYRSNSISNNGLPVTPATYEIAEGIVAYRDMLNLGASAANFSDRVAATNITGLRNAATDKGFASIGEVMAVRGDPPTSSSATIPDPYRIDYLAVHPPNPSGNTIGPLDFTPDTVGAAGGDLEKSTLVFSRISNLITVRSDVFTAYVLLQGRKLNPVTNLYDIIASQRRFIVTYDRSNIDGTTTAGHTSPQVVMFAEDH